MSIIQPQRAYVGVHLLLVQDNKLLLMKRRVKDGMEGMYALVAGKVDAFESPRQALAREAFEEVGVKIDYKDLDLTATIHHANTDYKSDKEDVIEFYFLPTKWSGVPENREPDKASDLGFYDLDALPSPLPNGLKRALAAMQGGPAFSEL